MKILVTGGGGFIGRNLTQKLIEEGHEVTITTTGSEPDLKVHKVLYMSLEGIDWSYVGGQDVVFHQMANNDTRCNDFQEMMRANFYGPIKLFIEAAEGGCKKFIYASSTAVYGNSPAPYTEDTTLDPLNYYANSKSKFDKFAMQFAKERNVSVVGLRYCNVYGPGETQKGRRMSMVGQMMQNILSNTPVSLFKDGNQKRDWVYVKDVVNANLLAMNSDVSGGNIYNIGSGNCWTFNEVYEAIWREIELRGIQASKHPINWIDCSFSDSYQNHTECCIDKARKELKYEPQYDLTAGISDYMK